MESLWLKWEGMMKKGNYNQARADVNRALQINPDYQSAQELSDELEKLGY
jgi:Tfp pilus assembly protein PilF